MKLFFTVFLPLYCIGASAGLAYLKVEEASQRLADCERVIEVEFDQSTFIRDFFRGVLERIDDRRPRCEFQLGVGEFDGRDVSDVVSGVMSRMDCTGGVGIHGAGIGATTITDFDFSALSEEHD